MGHSRFFTIPTADDDFSNNSQYWHLGQNKYAVSLCWRHVFAQLISLIAIFNPNGLEPKNPSA
jgi:hypothetical protein